MKGTFHQKSVADHWQQKSYWCCNLPPRNLVTVTLRNLTISNHHKCHKSLLFGLPTHYPLTRGYRCWVVPYRLWRFGECEQTTSPLTTTLVMPQFCRILSFMSCIRPFCSGTPNCSTISSDTILGETSWNLSDFFPFIPVETTVTHLGRDFSIEARTHTASEPKNSGETPVSQVPSARGDLLRVWRNTPTFPGVFNC